MKKDTYRNLDELGQHLYEKWYAQDWEIDKRRGVALATPIRYLALLVVLIGFFMLILAG